MKKYLIYLGIICGISLNVGAQTDSLDLLLQLGSEEPVKLIPKRMIFTQRMLWGEKGLMRTLKIAPLTDHGRETELKIRRGMLVTHQVLGFATLAGMVAQGIVGAKLYSGDYKIKDLHEGLGTAVNITYFTTAGLSLFTPPPLISRQVKGLNGIKMHKTLAVVHLSAMIATNLLADRAGDIKIKPLHRAAAFTAFGSFFGAMVVMKF
ncbi:MAG: hypothetical protein LW711_05660 [Saprospiraceae bacterium]|jgi:hypothetical protein|nr:hypothetical protein [Saprospiraceae bacterium]